MIFLETQVSTAHRVSPWLLDGEGHVKNGRRVDGNPYRSKGPWDYEKVVYKSFGIWMIVGSLDFHRYLLGTYIVVDSRVRYGLWVTKFWPWMVRPSWDQPNTMG